MSTTSSSAVSRRLASPSSGLKPGDRLPPERELVDKLRVSRTTVREALRVLESMGKIEIRRNEQLVVDPVASAISTQLKAVHPMSVEFLDYLVDVRAAIEDRVLLLVARAPGGRSRRRGRC